MHHQFGAPERDPGGIPSVGNMATAAAQDCVYSEWIPSFASPMKEMEGQTPKHLQVDRNDFLRHVCLGLKRIRGLSSPGLLSLLSLVAALKNLLSLLFTFPISLKLFVIGLKIFSNLIIF